MDCVTPVRRHMPSQDCHLCPLPKGGVGDTRPPAFGFYVTLQELHNGAVKLMACCAGAKQLE
jgi:hypothetical protein